jgi:hypothetical protein
LQVEVLETRTLPSVLFTPGSYVVPGNGPDQPLGQLENFGRAPKAIVETQVSINPTDPGNIAVSSQNGLKVSTDAGATFTATPTQYPVANSDGDTSTVFDSQGRLFWANLDILGGGNDAVAVTQLDPTTGAQIGTTNVVNTPSGTDSDDKEYMTVDSNNNLFVVWTRFSAGTTILVSRSTDQGITWSSPVAVSGAGEGFVWPSTVSVAPNGDVYVAYHSQPTFSGPNPDGTSGQSFVARYTNDLTTILSKTVAFGPGASDITFNVQTGSRVFTGTQFWTQGSAQPWVLADPARPGNVYVVANDDPNNGSLAAVDHADIVFARSTDNGSTWTTSTVESGSDPTFRLFPNAAIDKFGDIVVSWYDNSRLLTNSSGRYELDVFATYSTDGGLTWSPSFQVNDTTNAFDPDPNAINRFGGPPPTTRIGEYFGIALFGGTAYLAWNSNIFTGGVATAQQVSFGSFAVNGSVTVSGDDGGVPTDDNITLRSIAGNPTFIEVLVNGQRQYAGLTAALAGGISVNGLAGNDTLTVDFSNGNPVPSGGLAYDGGSGSNTLVLQGGAFTNESISPTGPTSGSISLDGSSVTFTNLATVTDTTAATNFSVSGTSAAETINVVSGPVANGFQTTEVNSDSSGTFVPVDFANKSNVTVFGGGGNDIINVQATPAGVPFTIDGFTGNVTVNINSSAPSMTGTLSNIAGPVNVVNSSGGHTTLNVSDFGSNTGVTATVTNSSITGLAPVAITYNAGQVSSVSLIGSGGNDTFNVQSTGVNTALSVDGGSGNDTVNVNGNAPSLSGTLVNIVGPISVSNTSGHTILNVGDEGDSAGLTATITNNAITGLAPAAITYSAGPVSAVNITGGTGNDVFNVQSTASTTPLTIDGSNGSDTVNVGSTAPALGGTVANIAGSISVGNTSGQTALVVDDSGDATGQTVSVTSSAVTGLAPAAINYTAGQVPSVSVHGGSGNDTFNVSPAASTAFNIDGGPPTTAPGDTLSVNLAGASNAFVTITSSNGASQAGNYTFGNLKTVTFANIETLPTVADPSINIFANAATVNPVAQVTYTITVTNSSSVGEKGITVTDTFPAALTDVTWTATATAGSQPGAAGGSGNINDTVTLAAGGTITYNVTATVPAGAREGPLANTATVTAPTGLSDPTPADNSATASIDVIGIHLLAAGSDAGGPPIVNVYDATHGYTQKFSFTAYSPFFLGGVRVAVGDINGDGVPDIIAGAGPGGGPEIKVFDGKSGAVIRDFFAFSPNFLGGVWVASGDINGDGFSDIIIGADAGGGPEVIIFSGKDNSVLQALFAYDPNFMGGVRVASGDVNGDGIADLVTAAGPGGGPHVEVFDGKALLQGSLVHLFSFFAYDPNFHGGVYLGTGDVNGDGHADIVTGAGPGGGPNVSVFSGANGGLVQNFFAYSPLFMGGVRVGSVGEPGENRANILTGAGPGGGPHVEVLDGVTLVSLDSFFTLDPSFTGGIFVGGH